MHWTVRDLAAKAGIHHNTVSNIEARRYAGTPKTLAAIRCAFEDAGVKFLARDGVRLTKR